MRKLLVAAGITALMAGAAPLWAGPADSSLTIGLNEEFPNYDAYLNTSRDGLVLSAHLYDTLIYRDPATFDYQSLLATKWTSIDDLTWEFELRPGVTFHDGSPLTADDVVFTLNYYANPDNGARYPSSVDWIDRVEKVDDLTVRVISKKPYPIALEYIANSLYIYPSDYFEKVGKDEFGRKPVGSGPYAVQSSSASEMVLKAYDGYYEGGGKGTPAIKTLTIRTIPDIATQIAEVMAGGIDWMWNVPADQVEQMKVVPTLKVELGSTMRIAMILIDAAGRTGADNPLTNVKVRQALNHAIDRETIVANLVGGDGEVLHAPCYPKQFGCDQDAAVRYEYDPEKAKALLKEAGYENGFTVNLGSYRDRSRAEAVQTYLKAVGVTANLEMLQARASFSSWREGKVGLWYGDGGSFSIGDAAASVGSYFDGSSNDGFDDAEVNGLLADAIATVDKEQRKKLYSEAIKLITERAYWVPMHTVVMGYAYNKDLNYTMTVDELPRFFTASWNQ